MTQRRLAVLAAAFAILALIPLGIAFAAGPNVRVQPIAHASPERFDNVVIFDRAVRGGGGTLYVDGGLAVFGTITAGSFGAASAASGTYTGRVVADGGFIAGIGGLLVQGGATVTGLTVSDGGFTAGPGGLLVYGLHRNIAQALSVADDAAGTVPASTLTPTSSFVECSCLDPDGCDITMGETGMTDGVVVEIAVIAGVCNFADTDGVSNLSAAFAAGDDDVLTLRYATNEWVEVARSNN
jgi:hypothetical protein